MRLAHVVLAGAAAASLALAQTAGRDFKNAGKETENAAKSAGSGVVKGAKQTGHAVKKGSQKVTNKTATGVEKGAAAVRRKTQ